MEMFHHGLVGDRCDQSLTGVGQFTRLRRFQGRVVPRANGQFLHEMITTVYIFSRARRPPQGTCLVTRCPMAGSSSSINFHSKPTKGWALKEGKASVVISTSGRRQSRLNGWVLRVFAVVHGNTLECSYGNKGTDQTTTHPGPALDVVSPHRFTFCIDCFESGSEGRAFCCRINLARNRGPLISGRARPAIVPPRDD